MAGSISFFVPKRIKHLNDVGIEHRRVSSTNQCSIHNTADSEIWLSPKSDFKISFISVCFMVCHGRVVLDLGSSPC